MEKFAECVQDSEQLKSALLEMQVSFAKCWLVQVCALWSNCPGVKFTETVTKFKWRKGKYSVVSSCSLNLVISRWCCADNSIEMY